MLAVVSATLGVVTPSLARIVGRDRSHRASTPAWLWQSHVYGGDSTPAETSTTAKSHVKRSRRPYKPPVARRRADDTGSNQASWPQP